MGVDWTLIIMKAAIQPCEISLLHVETEGKCEGKVTQEHLEEEYSQTEKRLAFK